MDTVINSKYNIKLYPVENEFIACLDTTNAENSKRNKNSRVETVVILDRSGSMDQSVYKIVHKILPKFFENLSYDPDTTVHLIAFESTTKVHKIKVGDFKDMKMFSAGGTLMAPAVAELHKLFEHFQSTVTSLRILTISDGMVEDQQQTKELGGKLAEFAEKCNISVNSQAVRFFTSYAQPDTTALCSLLQLNDVNKPQMIDVSAIKHHDKIAKEMSELFENDGFDSSLILKSSDAIFYKFPWYNQPSDQILILPQRKNVFWVDAVPNEEETIIIDGLPVTVTVEETNVNTLQFLFNSKLDFVIDRMKVLKIVNSDMAKLKIEKMVEYFSRLESIIPSLITDEIIDSKSIANRARFPKLNNIKAKKITTLLQTIANDDKVNKLNAEQKAAYLRNVEGATKAGHGLAKRNAKKKLAIGGKELTFSIIISVIIYYLFSSFKK